MCRRTLRSGRPTPSRVRTLVTRGGARRDARRAESASFSAALLRECPSERPPLDAPPQLRVPRLPSDRDVTEGSPVRAPVPAVRRGSSYLGGMATTCLFIPGGTAPRQNGARLEQPGGAAPATHGFFKPGAELRDWPSTWSFQTTVKRFQGAAAFVACTRSRSRCLFQALLQVPRGEREFFQPQPDP